MSQKKEIDKIDLFAAQKVVCQDERCKRVYYTTHTKAVVKRCCSCGGRNIIFEEDYYKITKIK